LVTTVVGLSLSYLFLVVRDQPLDGSGGTSGAYPAHPEHGPLSDSDAYVADYIDGGTITVVTTLTNLGRFPVMVTGVHTDPVWWVGLARLAAARPAAMHTPPSCCDIDDKATWAATGFHPMHLGPTDEGVLELHMFMSHCEIADVGTTAELDDLTVDYDEMGWHHTSEVRLTTPLVVRFGLASECLRPHVMHGNAAAPPTAAPPAPSTPG